MTPARQPQQEHIITSKEVDSLQRNLSIPTTRILDDIRSRTHPAPARTEKCCKGCEAGMCAEACQTWINEHDAQVAKAARLEGNAEAYGEIIPLLDARTKAYTTANLRLAGIRLKIREQQEPQR